MKRLAFLLFVLAPMLFGQDLSSGFVIDKSKPYVYLAFDHIGKGKAYFQGDDSERIYLRVVNNCRIPIVFRSANAPDADPGYILEGEVIAEPQGIRIISDREMGFFEQEQKLREEANKHKPDGYWFETSGMLRVQPGKDALFSVPRNHVGQFWFLRVKFALEVNRSSVAVGPFTYLDFHDYDLPKAK